MNKLAFLKTPISANIEITDLCNQKCFFCFCKTEKYQQSLSSLSSKEKIDNLIKILEILAMNNVFEIRFLGGEILLLDGWRDVIRRGHELNFFMSFISNGTMFTEEDICFLSNNGIKEGNISIHGFEEVHDDIVGVPGSFQKIIKTIPLFRDNGIDINVLFTPNKLNISSLEEFSRMLVNAYGVKNIGVNRLFSNDDRYDRLFLKDYLGLFDLIEKLNKEEINVFFADSFPICRVPIKYWKFLGGCSQGVGFCQINFLGNLKNCSSLSVGIGNIFKERLDELWEKQLRGFRELEHLPLSCKLCPTFCGGGCIASRTTDRNFVADEFIYLPKEESLLETSKILIKNYLKSGVYRLRESLNPIEKSKKWSLSEKPSLKRRFRIRKEGVDSYVCMIEGKGVFYLDENSKLILDSINADKTITEIMIRTTTLIGEKIEKIAVEDVLNMFCM